MIIEDASCSEHAHTHQRSTSSSRGCTAHPALALQGMTNAPDGVRGLTPINTLRKFPQSFLPSHVSLHADVSLLVFVY